MSKEQNSYGETQYCSRCSEELEKARAFVRKKMICQSCQRKKAREYARNKKKYLLLK